jgi:hypothetical protein
VRQWVLSLPFELRALAAFRADVLSALARVFVESVFARHRVWANHQWLRGDAPSGAVTFVQRFGSSVNLNVHFHTLMLDGVFTRVRSTRPQPTALSNSKASTSRRASGSPATTISDANACFATAPVPRCLSTDCASFQGAESRIASRRCAAGAPSTAS